jgi:hypothetical protein
MSDDMTIRLDGEEYVVRLDGDTVKVGRQAGGEATWLDDVDSGLFPDAAREAVERGDTSDESLLTALRGIVQAEIERGG